MTVIDLMDPEERRKAVETGLIWSAPRAAVEHALRDIKAGLIPAPTYIPSEWQPFAESMGIAAVETNPMGESIP